MKFNHKCFLLSDLMNTGRKTKKCVVMLAVSGIEYVLTNNITVNRRHSVL